MYVLTRSFCVLAMASNSQDAMADGADLMAVLKARLVGHPSQADCKDGECMVCAIRPGVCEFTEPLHFHHDGCPACYTDTIIKEKIAKVPTEPAVPMDVTVDKKEETKTEKAIVVSLCTNALRIRGQMTKITMVYSSVERSNGKHGLEKECYALACEFAENAVGMRFTGYDNYGPNKIDVRLCEPIDPAFNKRVQDLHLRYHYVRPHQSEEEKKRVSFHVSCGKDDITLEELKSMPTEFSIRGMISMCDHDLGFIFKFGSKTFRDTIQAYVDAQNIDKTDFYAGTGVLPAALIGDSSNQYDVTVHKPRRWGASTMCANLIRTQFFEGKSVTIVAIGRRAADIIQGKITELSSVSGAPPYHVKCLSHEEYADARSNPLWLPDDITILDEFAYMPASLVVKSPYVLRIGTNMAASPGECDQCGLITPPYTQCANRRCGTQLCQSCKLIWFISTGMCKICCGPAWDDKLINGSSTIAWIVDTLTLPH